VKFGTEERTGATCRPCGAKNPKIDPLVKTIPAELPAEDPAGNTRKVANEIKASKI